MNLQKSKTIVIKIGSTSLVDEENNLRREWIKSLVDDIKMLMDLDTNIIIVSSGSVAAGKDFISSGEEMKIEEKQAAASCGQPILFQEYTKCFNSVGYKTSQILLTIHDLENRRSYLNAKNTLDVIFDNGIVPIINENDTVATQELRFGDNDRLSALVAQMVSADSLILLSDIDGLYNDDPNKNSNAKHIPVVEKITEEVESLGKGSFSNKGSGGMFTKIQAALIASDSGCETIIMNSNENNPIKRLIKGEKHTLFKCDETPLNARKNWISNSLVSYGKIIVDNGAAKALKNNNSLLAIGITSVEGEFLRGDKVQVMDQAGEIIAKGISAYASADIDIIRGKQSSEIEDLIGYSGREAVIHVNDLALA